MTTKKVLRGAWRPREETQSTTILLVSQAEKLFHFDSEILEDARYKFCPIFERWIEIDYCRRSGCRKCTTLA
jgi:hypothetical protein